MQPLACLELTRQTSALGAHGMTALGSLPEWQKFVANGAKLQDRFQDRASTPLMTEDGWEGEWHLWHNCGDDQDPKTLTPFEGLLR